MEAKPSPPSLLTIFFYASAMLQTSAFIPRKVALIHRDSPLSPFHNPNASLADYWSSFLVRSDLRRDYLQSILLTNTSSRARGPAAASRRLMRLRSPFMFGEYLMKFSLGTPPVEFLGAVDLNGDFIHVQCVGCVGCGDCRKTGIPSFDLDKSSTYVRVPCAGVICSNQDQHCCAGWDRCEYTRTTPDGKSTTGILATDTLRVTTYAGGEASFTGFGFGCCTQHCPIHNKDEDVQREDNDGKDVLHGEGG